MLVATAAFANTARALASFKRYPHLPVVTLPHPFTTLDRATVERIAHEYADELIDALVATRGGGTS